MSYTESVSKKLNEKGLIALCQVQLAAEDWRIIFASIGQGWFAQFQRSTFAQDGLADPMDRYTKALFSEIFADCDRNKKLIYPFDKPDYPPFQSWVKQAQSSITEPNSTQAPFGMLIHPVFGQWMAFRAALVSHKPWPHHAFWQISAMDSNKVNCHNCSDQNQAAPCSKPCPIKAITIEKGYDFNACRDYLRSTPDAPCHQQGCLARLACPAGSNYATAQNSADFICRHLFAKS